MADQAPDDLVIDGHCHIGRNLRGEELIDLMDKAGVAKAVVFVSPSLWGPPGQAEYEDTNDYIADMQREYPERLIGFACVNPHVRPGRELERCINELGLRGLKIHPECHCFAVDSLVGGELMETVSGLQKDTGMRIPVISHGMTTIGAMPDQFGRLAGRYPDVTIIIAHGAGFQNLYFPSYAALTEHDNLFVDTAMTTIDDQHLVGVARQIGVEKVIFGTDHFVRGHTNLYGNFRYVLERAFPDPADRRLIMGRNMARILAMPTQ
jgi:predicted TIM-barrel fold metal-dependent hydrolase